ncbi:MAG: SDR family oxidoreductase [Gammaproteobacteria bacterium]|jgi:NAD(P)-dependent dehydrogenase (short-subunit alcohol dehydrogenase family)|nr:SDR family oxidoreductase [Gammaproteobacteria bacterium]MBU1491145.1 SDR family oxidoreductase [Gammaproteobacteria bacterium]MBU2065909.1 SDR family oxidoreductase [Gammaproteobacteria bacterium]MBU2141235.1 SDR family oxidoreductase [Gammaproteobacteria bacterium]MBU2215823.1 SDR family oxidoreductase [Gammaproteobacteria bacterium]
MQTILITGAASGIGAATARLFHARGWAVGLLDLDGVALQRLADELAGAWFAAVDVCDEPAVQQSLAEFCGAHGGQLHVLFNGAGILRCGPFEQLSLAEQLLTVQINISGLLTVTHCAFAYLKNTPQAQVINMGSASALYGVPQMATYSASKCAVRGFTEALELEWAAHGIRVGNLMPPFVNTPMVTGQGRRPPVMRRLGVHLDAEDIALAAWQQAQAPKVHRPISLQFGLLYWADQFSPSLLSRWVMRWLSRP